MNPNHLTSMNEESLFSALKPLMFHNNWAYFEEYLRREQLKQVTLGMKANDPIDIYRVQGQSAVYGAILALKSRMLEASK